MSKLSATVGRENSLLTGNLRKNQARERGATCHDRLRGEGTEKRKKKESIGRQGKTETMGRER